MHRRRNIETFKYKSISVVKNNDHNPFKPNFVSRITYLPACVHYIRLKIINNYIYGREKNIRFKMDYRNRSNNNDDYNNSARSPVTRDDAGFEIKHYAQLDVSSSINSNNTIRDCAP